MEYCTINNKVLDIFIDCNVNSFPLDCEIVLSKLGYKLYKYSELSDKKRLKCMLVSEESFKLHDIIYYNDEKNIRRIRFSIMHELGHIVLKHGEYRNSRIESEANYFASNILAPRMAIHYSRCINHLDVAKTFNISIEAAQYAFDDYRRWHRKAVYKMSPFDKAMYSHFYKEELKCFVYSINKCKLCGTELYNEATTYCDDCYNRLSFIDYSKQDNSFRVAEENWLYGGI